jgi:replication-associated recombination protein RarA
VPLLSQQHCPHSTPSKQKPLLKRQIAQQLTLLRTHNIFKGIKVNDNKYQPKTINEFVFGNSESRELIEDIVNGNLPFPFGGKTGILLYGAYGTGKTTLADMLPELIEQAQTGNELAMGAEFFGCLQGHSGTQINDIVKRQNNVLSLNASHCHYFIFDEVDNLSKLAQSGLKTTLNSNRAVFILTTNNISKLDKGVKDRCVLVEMNAATDSEFLPLARRIAADEGVVLNDAQLLTAISGNDGSFRSVIFNVLRLCLRTARQNKSAQSLATAVIQQAAKGQ